MVGDNDVGLLVVGDNVVGLFDGALDGLSVVGDTEGVGVGSSVDTSPNMDPQSIPKSFDAIGADPSSPSMKNWFNFSSSTSITLSFDCRLPSLLFLFFSFFCSCVSVPLSSSSRTARVSLSSTSNAECVPPSSDVAEHWPMDAIAGRQRNSAEDPFIFK